MSSPHDALFLFGLLAFLHLWGGAAIGSGACSRQILPVIWGLLIGGAPLFLGIERAVRLGSSAALIWQVACLVVAALGAFHLPRLRAVFLHRAMTSIMAGMLLMTAGALVGAWFERLGAQVLSLMLGGPVFMWGAMWLGGGIKQLRAK